MSTLRIELPWPETRLWPNRNLGQNWRYRQSAKADAKTTAYLLAQQARGDEYMPGDSIPVTWTFHAPTRRKFDAGGVYGAMKAYEDGMASALLVDDSQFWPVTLKRGAPVKGGSVTVEIG